MQMGTVHLLPCCTMLGAHSWAQDTSPPPLQSQEKLHAMEATALQTHKIGKFKFSLLVPAHKERAGFFLLLIPLGTRGYNSGSKRALRVGESREVTKNQYSTFHQKNKEALQDQQGKKSTGPLPMRDDPAWNKTTNTYTINSGLGSSAVCFLQNCAEFWPKNKTKNLRKLHT